VTASGACTTLAGVLADVTPSQTQTGAASQTPTLTNVLLHMYRLKKLALKIEVRTTALPRPHALDSAAANGLGRDTPHASPRWLAADNITVEAYYYGRQSVLIGRRSRYSCSTHIFAS